MDNQNDLFQSSSNQAFETKAQVSQILLNNAEQQFQFDNQNQSQQIQEGINEVLIPNEPKAMVPITLSNSQRLGLKDQQRAQLQNSNNNQEQSLIGQQIPIQQQQQIQYQQQQQFIQQIPLSQQYQSNNNRANQNIFNIQQQVPQQQQQSQGQLGKVQNYVNNLLGNDPQQQFKYEPTNNFNDDDDILKQYQKQDGLQINIEEMIELKVQAQYDYCKLKKSEKQILPAMVSIITKDIEQYAKNNSSIEAGIDLLCVIDKSGSMQGEKIRSVQQSLDQLLNFLSEKDRLCLIVFDGRAQRHTPLKTLTKVNKKYFQNAIVAITAGGSTNIAAGTEIAFQQIQQRKMKNQVTSIFLLSDGQDPGAAQIIQQQKDKIEDVVTIHSFGYGSDHDAALMSSICKVGQGSFYYIENLKLLDEFFADALGRLSSALAENIQIEIKCAPQAPYQDIKIQKTYGDMWKLIQQDRSYEINLPQIASDSRKDFVFEIVLPPFTKQILDEQRVPQVVHACLSFKNTFSKKVYQKVSVLQLKLYNQDEQIGENDPNPDVTREILRVQATEAIEQARMKCELSKNEEAEEMLETMKQLILSDQKMSGVSAQAIIDIDQAKNASKRQNYSNFGMKQMCQMFVNNYQQEGLNAQFDFSGQQMQQVDQGMFQNSKQLKMVKEVQKRKS
ncbi:unnamed protein product [Paramecium pentaurelia]|uniref:VWFA domain-containing protein n=1 Tax=Paramecium pentaurelia TaxID=43138 RepID=A0A8S1T3M4_9CILI|nr:unnamed protein product [Paramecium pentaurelia]